MEENRFLFRIPTIDIDRLVEIAKKILRNERNDVRSNKELRKAIVRVVENRFDRFADGLPEKFASPGSKEFIELEEILSEPILQLEKVMAAEAVAKEGVPQGILFEDKPGILNGQRVYAAQKFEAMIEYIAFAGKNIFQTNLNKMLFYADFGFFHLQGISISGATYKRLPHGPVNDQYRNTLDSMEKRRKLRSIRIKTKGKDARILRAKKTYDPTKSILTENEKKLIDWVLEEVGELRSGEISDLSHKETGYKNTAKGEPISYAFAEDLKILPPRDLFD